MNRNLSELSKNIFDLVIVGGGIFGVCAAWDAVSRGLSVALVEKGDFAHATSANHFKIVHGGIRYLQHMDIKRIRESSHERAALLRIAPHLVSPMPIVIPTYRHGLKGKTVLKTGMLIYDLITMDRNRGLQEGNMIPRGKFLSKNQVLDYFPAIESDGLTGGAVFCDGQMYNPPRIAVSFLKSATAKGLAAANYVEVTGFLKNNLRIYGVTAKNLLTGDEFEIRSKVVLNTSGPWAHRIIEDKLNLELDPRPVFSRDLALVVKKKPLHKFGLALTTKSEDADSIIDRGGRHLFIVPWRGYTLIGVWHKIFDRAPEKIVVADEELEEYANEVNKIYPSLNFSVGDIAMVNTGLTLFGSKKNQGKMTMSFGKRSLIIDHAKAHRIEGILTLVGVRATTARGMAEKAIQHVFKKLGKIAPASQTANLTIYGGDINDLNQLTTDANRQYNDKFNQDVISNLIHNYGSRFEDVLQLVAEDSEHAKTLNGTNILRAEIVSAIRSEMAQRLSDVVFRRTDMATAGHPGEKALKECLQITAKELGWNEQRTHNEYCDVQAALNNLRNNV